LYNSVSCKADTSSHSSSSGNSASLVEIQPIEYQSRTLRRFMSYAKIKTELLTREVLAILYNSKHCIMLTLGPSFVSVSHGSRREYDKKYDQERLEIARGFFANQCMKWYWKCLEESSIGINKLGRPCIEWKSLLR
jgi:hypothetical protein